MLLNVDKARRNIKVAAQGHCRSALCKSSPLLSNRPKPKVAKPGYHSVEYFKGGISQGLA